MYLQLVAKWHTYLNNFAIILKMYGFKHSSNKTILVSFTLHLKLNSHLCLNYHTVGFCLQGRNLCKLYKMSQAYKFWFYSSFNLAIGLYVSKSRTL